MTARIDVPSFPASQKLLQPFSWDGRGRGSSFGQVGSRSIVVAQKRQLIGLGGNCSRKVRRRMLSFVPTHALPNLPGTPPHKKGNCRCPFRRTGGIMGKAERDIKRDEHAFHLHPNSMRYLRRWCVLSWRQSVKWSHPSQPRSPHDVLKPAQKDTSWLNVDCKASQSLWCGYFSLSYGETHPWLL